jgi:hypothetical protein
MRLLALVLLVGIAVVRTCAQSAPPVDPMIVLEMSIATNQREFHLGETIPLQLSFSSTVKEHYQVNMAQYDRGGRMNYERFEVSPANGAVDPLPTYTGSLGGLTNFKYLSPEPWIIKLNLNEWVWFSQPGDYRIVVSSRRVGVRDPSKAFGTTLAIARSNVVAVKIVPANPEWQKQVLREAVATLDVSAPAKAQPEKMEQYTASRRRAFQTLRFLGTADSIRELAKRMRAEDSGGLDYICMLGLISSPERDVARTALEAELADPDHPIDGNFLYALRMVSLEGATLNANSQEAQQRVVEELIAALPIKRGKSLTISLNTAVGEAWNGNGVPKQTTDKLVAQLMSRFDELPSNVQNSLLTYNWSRIGSPAMLPLLQRYAESYHDFPEMRDANAYQSLELSASALKHWYELDPKGARPAIITEITRPRPRFSAKVLGILPDETLPEVDLALAEHFSASHDSDGSSNLASLIARYASEAILPQVTEKLDPRIGRWACDIQNPILAYVLRINPALARPRIEQALAARGDEFSACNQHLFGSIAEIRYDPVLDEIAIGSLEDPDPQVAISAVTMLGHFGSAEAETALWQRYAKWSVHWEGRESELEFTPADSTSRKMDDRIYQLGLGQSLMQALATGKSWLSDKTRLQRLSQLTKVRRIQQQLDGYLKIWEDPILRISFVAGPEPFSFHAQVAQYEFQSLVALKDKVAQFPSGTKFFLSGSQVASPANDQTIAELRTFLSSHGMSVAEEKRAN